MSKVPEGVTQFVIFAFAAAIFGPLAWFLSGGPDLVNAIRMANDPPPPAPRETVEAIPDEFPQPSEFAQLGTGMWICEWDPTVNNNWHDDVLCTDGVDDERPYLLPEDNFVDKGEIMRAAAEHEDQLNSR